uniref:Secreted protein n=1 Tax=Anguilla anguilla TaxID=7936 RepID=A0A0E9UIF0_ANGAN
MSKFQCFYTVHLCLFLKVCRCRAFGWCTVHCIHASHDWEVQIPVGLCSPATARYELALDVH